jgi:hypothetical protein
VSQTARHLELDSSIHSVLLVGDYGSGKTEVAVNLALSLSRSEEKRPVAIADLDLVNPYFRCREAHEPLEEAGIRVVMPQGGHQFADLPILLPQVKGLLQDDQTLSVLDVGGDEVGSRVLAGLSPSFSPERHHFLFVVNGNRPFNDTPERCLTTIKKIEEASRIRVTGLVSNTHMMDETTAPMVFRGVELAEAVAAELGVGVAFVSVMEEVVAEVDQGSIPHPLLVMGRIMVPPWRRRSGADVAAFRLGTS